jgi:hypothetical protein
MGMLKCKNPQTCCSIPCRQIVIALLQKKRGGAMIARKYVAVLKYVKRSRSTGHDVSNSCNELHHSCNELDHSYYTMLAFLHVQGQLMIHVRNA